MSIPTSITLAYTTGVMPSQQQLAELSPRQIATVLKLNSVLQAAHLKHLNSDYISQLNQILQPFSVNSGSIADEQFIKNIQQYLKQDSNSLEKFIARFDLQEEHQGKGDIVQQQKESAKKACISGQNASSDRQNDPKFVKIVDQSSFDSRFTNATRSERVELASNKFALKSTAFMRFERQLYFSTFSAYDVVHNFSLNFTIEEVCRYSAELLKCKKEQQQLLAKLADRDILRTHPGIAKTVLEYILQSNLYTNQLFHLRKELGLDDKRLYDICIDGMTDNKKQFTLTDADYVALLFELFISYLTQRDYDQIYKDNKEMFQKFIQDKCLTKIVAAALYRQFDTHLDHQLLRFPFFSISCKSNLKTLKLYAMNIKLSEFQLYFSDQPQDYQTLIQIQPNITIQQEFYSQQIQTFDLPIDCAVRCYQLIFKAGNEYYQYSYQYENEQQITQVLSKHSIILSGGIQKARINCQQVVDSDADHQIEIPFNTFTQESTNQVEVINSQLKIQSLLVTKPDIKRILDIEVEQSNLSSGCFEFCINKVGHYLLFQNQKQFVPAKNLSLCLSTINNGKKSIIYQNFNIDITKKLQQIQLDTSALFYSQSLEYIFSSQIEGQNQNYTSSIKLYKNQYIFVKQYVYLNRILAHFFTAQHQIVGSSVQCVLNFDSSIDDCQNLTLTTDDNGCISIETKYIDHLNSIDYSIQRYQQSYHFQKTVNYNNNSQVPQLYIQTSTLIQCPAPEKFTFSISGQQLRRNQQNLLELPQNQQEGEYELIMTDNNGYSTICAQLCISIADAQYPIATVQLPIIYNFNGQFLIPSFVDDKNIFATFNLQSDRRIQHFIFFMNVPYKKQYTENCEFHCPEQLNLTNQQIYLQKLNKAFSDPFLCASLAQKAPCLFLKEELEATYNPPPVPMKPMMRDQVRCNKCAANNINRGGMFAMASRAMPEMFCAKQMCMDAPGGMMQRHEQVMKRTTAQQLQISDYNGPDLSLNGKLHSSFNITKFNAELKKIDIQPAGATTVKIVLMGPDWLSTCCETLDFSQASHQFIVPHQLEISQNVRFSVFSTSSRLADISPLFSSELHQMLTSWNTSSLDDKIDTFKHYCCYELALFVKINDSNFWKQFGRQLFQQRNSEQNAVQAFILDELTFFDSINFLAISPIEQFCYVLSGKCLDSDKQMFIQMCALQRESTDKEIVDNLQGLTPVENSNDTKATMHQEIQQTRFSSSSEQTFYKYCTDDCNSSYCALMAHIINNDVIKPDFLQQSANQREFLFALLAQHQFYIENVAEDDTVQSNSAQSNLDNTVILRLQTNTRENCCLKDQICQISLQANSNEQHVFQTRFAITGVDLLSEYINDDFRVYSQSVTNLVTVFAQNDFTIELMLYENGKLFQHKQFDVEAIKQEVHDLEWEFKQEIAQINDIQQIYCLFVEKYSRLSLLAFARSLANKQFTQKQIYDLFMKLYYSGISNPYLARMLISVPELYQKAIQAFYESSWQDNNVYKILEEYQLDRCPAVKNHVLNDNSNNFDKLIDKQAFKTLFNGDFSSLFFYLVKFNQLNYAEQIKSLVKNNARFGQILSYYGALLNQNDYSVNLQFNTFSSRTAARNIQRLGNLKQFSARLENNSIIVNGNTSECIIFMQNSQYQQTDDIFTTSDEHFTIDCKKVANITILYDNKQNIMQFNNNKLDLSHQLRGNILYLQIQGKPASQLLVIQRDNGIIKRACYSDFRGAALINMQWSVEIYENLQKMCEIVL